MMVVLICFGSEFVEKDKLTLDIFYELKDEIKNIEFIACTQPHEILNFKNYGKVFILDVVEGIDDVCIIKNLNLLKKRKISTLHDFDLGFFLKILNKIEKLKNVEIIGVPANFKKELAKEKVKKILLDKVNL